MNLFLVALLFFSAGLQGIGIKTVDGASSILYVKQDAAGSGSSWANAFGTLQEALEVVQPGQEIWIAAGTYSPTKVWEGAEDPDDPKRKTFQMKNGVQIYGGFPATGAPGMDERNVESHETILSGKLDENTNAFQIFYHPEVLALNHTAVLNGVTIREGGNDTSHDSGAGMYNHKSSPTLENVVFTNNVGWWGGAIYNKESSPVLKNVTIIDNKAFSQGGGIYNQNSDTKLTDSLISNNKVIGNVGTNHNNWAYGGGMYTVGIDKSPTLKNVVISHNEGVWGGGIYNASDSTLDFVQILNNRATHGGGMYTTKSSPLLTNVTISGNKTGVWHGGGIHITNDASYNEHFANANNGPKIINALISGNEAGYTHQPGEGYGLGGGIFIHNAHVTLTNVTLSGNKANKDGGSIYYNSDLLRFDGLKIQNSILSGNSSGIKKGSGTKKIAITASLIGDIGDMDAWEDNGSNRSGDPLFENGVSYSNAPTASGDYRLKSGSPAINAGNNDLIAGVLTDVDGYERIVGGSVDMGPYEYQTNWQANRFLLLGEVSPVSAGEVIQIKGTKTTLQLPSDLPVGTTLEVVLAEKQTVGDGLEVAGEVLNFKFTFPSGHTDYSGTFTLSLGVDDGFDAEKTGIYYYNEQENKWELVGGKGKAVAGIITIEVNHFSIYGVLAETDVLPPVGKDALIDEIEIAISLLEDEERDIEARIALIAAIESAQDVSENEGATQEEINNAVTVLSTAIEQYKKIESVATWPIGAAITSKALTDKGFEVSFPNAISENHAVKEYKIYMNTSEVAVATINHNNEVMFNHYTVTGLQPSTTYKVTVFAIDTMNNKSAPLHATITTSPKPATGGGGSGYIPSDNAHLESLKVLGSGKPLELSPVFSGTTFDYKIETDNTHISLDLQTAHAAAKAYVKEKEIRDNLEIALEEGNNDIKVVVKAENGTTKVYTLTIKRKTVESVDPISFTDIKGHWAQPYIEKGVSDGLIKGYPDGKFKPGANLTRSQAASLIVRALGLKSDKAAPFVDIGAYAKETNAEIGVAYHYGLIQGYTDGTFKPSSQVTRAQFALMLHRAYTVKMGTAYIPSAKEQYADIGNYDEEVVNAISMLYELEIATGFEGKYMPGNPTTRAHAAKMIVNFFNES